jgi:hypothetical protein
MKFSEGLKMMSTQNLRKYVENISRDIKNEMWKTKTY